MNSFFIFNWKIKKFNYYIIFYFVGFLSVYLYDTERSIIPITLFEFLCQYFIFVWRNKGAWMIKKDLNVKFVSCILT